MFFTVADRAQDVLHAFADGSQLAKLFLNRADRDTEPWLY
jgi:hypothetical protein